MNKPLAYRLRPENLDEILGQTHILSKDKPLYKLIKSGKIPSMIFYGPAGTGKTTIAEIISKTTEYKMNKINAVTSGIGDIKQIIDENQQFLLNPKGRSILFIDEIHRWNKAQQDVLLPYVENGQIILIGATTENPIFSVNKALLSRVMTFKLEKLKDEEIIQGIKYALKVEKGLKNYNVKITDNQIELIARMSSGDIRFAYNLLEALVNTGEISANGEVIIKTEDIKDLIPTRKQYFDRTGEEHFDNISALIKSIRGSDENASLHYLAKLLQMQEDPVFIARRLVISAAEDIGLANPNALVMATSAMTSVAVIGMPEARIILSEVVVYLAKSKKSNNTYVAINRAIEDVKKNDVGEIPKHLINSEITSGRANYLYPHDYPNANVKQQYMPDKLINKKYYINKWGNDLYE